MWVILQNKYGEVWVRSDSVVRVLACSTEERDEKGNDYRLEGCQLWGASNNVIVHMVTGTEEQVVTVLCGTEVPGVGRPFLPPLPPSVIGPRTGEEEQVNYGPATPLLTPPALYPANPAPINGETLTPPPPPPLAECPVCGGENGGHFGFCDYQGSTV